MTATGEGEGGIARWLRLTEGSGSTATMSRSRRGVLPATHFAVDAYVRFVRERSRCSRRSPPR